jgi:elongation factor G
MLLDNIVTCFPIPLEGPAIWAWTTTGEMVEFAVSPGAEPAAFVWKSVSDQYESTPTSKVVPHIEADMPMVNARTGNPEKLGRLYLIKGKKTEEVKKLSCGDIGAIGKMDKVKTGDTLCDARKVVALKQIPFAEPCYSVAIVPKTRGQEDKIAQGLARLNEEDPTFTVSNNAETHQMVLSGSGDMQMDVILSRLKSRFGVDAELTEPRVPYREKIRKKVEVQAVHKNQTGGHGQFGDVWMRSSPASRRNWSSARRSWRLRAQKLFSPVEKGLREAVTKGVLAGYPVVT